MPNAKYWPEESVKAASSDSSTKWAAEASTLRSPSPYRAIELALAFIRILSSSANLAPLSAKVTAFVKVPGELAGICAVQRPGIEAA